MKRIIAVIIKKMLSSHCYAQSIGVSIGENCIISTKSFGSEPFLISLGNNVHITKGVQFVNHDGGVHVFRHKIKEFDVFGKITIGDNTYIGNNAIILPGVSIGKDCVIGANSVVTKSIPDQCVVAGNPARFISSTDEYYQKILHKNAETKGLTGEIRKQKILELPIEKLIIKKVIRCD